MRKYKFTAVFLSFFMLLSLLAGCGEKKDENTGKSEEKTTATAEQKEEGKAEEATEAKAEEETEAKAEEETEAKAEEKPLGEVDKIDWAPYDELINKIKTETNAEKRAQYMHEAETMLMDTGAILPLYHYNDVFMMKEKMKGVKTNAFGFKFFQFAEVEGKDQIDINVSSEPEKLDPALNTAVDGAILCVNSFAGLYTYDEKGLVVPDLAEKAEVSEDGLTWTFTLKDDLKWSDGSKLDANDFVYAWKRAANPETAADYSYMMDIIEGYPDNLNVTASEDGKVLTAKLSKPCPYMLQLAAFPIYFPVPKAAVEGAEGYKDADGKVKNPGAWALEAGFISNGPFVLKEWKHEQSMTYEKNPNYHEADKVKVNKLVFMLSVDQPAILAAYESDQLDFIDSIPTNEIENMKTRPDYHLVDQLGTYFIVFNVNNQELFGGKTKEQAIALRKAIACLVDRNYIIEAVAQTGQRPATSFIPDAMEDGNGKLFHDDGFTYPLEGGYVVAEPDADMAREYLEAAGYTLEDGKLSEDTPLNLTYITNESESHVKIAEIIQQDLKEVGITMEIKTMQWNNFQQERKAGNFGIARHGWIADFSDPINMLEMWQTESGNNDAQLGK